MAFPGRMISGKSLLNITKKNGPSMEPCGTPDIGDCTELTPVKEMKRLISMLTRGCSGKTRVLL